VSAYAWMTCPVFDLSVFTSSRPNQILSAMLVNSPDCKNGSAPVVRTLRTGRSKFRSSPPGPTSAPRGWPITSGGARRSPLPVRQSLRIKCGLSARLEPNRGAVILPQPHPLGLLMEHSKPPRAPHALHQLVIHVSTLLPEQSRDPR
jgi:hypothetical protein